MFIKMTKITLILSLFLAISVTEVNGGCRVQADIMFLLDNSASVGKGNFRNILKFVKRFPGSDMKIGPKDLQIGVMSYHSVIHKEFSLNKYTDIKSFRRGVRYIKYHGGSTRTDKAITRMTSSIFAVNNGARADVTKICFVITDGNSHHEYRTRNAAFIARNHGIVMFAIGIGRNVNMRELKDIASNPDDNFVYQRSNSATLKYLRNKLINRVCNVSRPKPPPGCSPKADIVFILDSSGSISAGDFNLMLAFVKRFFQSFPIGNDAYQFGVQTFSNNAYLEFNLISNKDVQSLLAAMNSITKKGGGTATHKALQLVRQTMFKPINGDRTNAPNIAVVITDGHAGNHKATVREAKKVRSAGIKVFAVGVGSKIDWSEINQIASNPVKDHVVSVSNFSKLKESIEEFTKKVCKGTHK